MAMHLISLATGNACCRRQRLFGNIKGRNVQSHTEVQDYKYRTTQSYVFTTLSIKDELNRYHKGKSRRRNSTTCVRDPLTRRVVNRGMCTSGRDLRERANKPTPRTDSHNISLSASAKTALQSSNSILTHSGQSITHIISSKPNSRHRLKLSD
ncbi:Uncharacterized protein Fot_07687 [Forsythia ovata]|uniref:Uncharacterized protein n=1 Tax=Forsythia ovata TaxID=205694 RepID=A0ABD1WWI5_9LAMI